MYVTDLCLSISTLRQGFIKTTRFCKILHIFLKSDILQLLLKQKITIKIVIAPGLTVYFGLTIKKKYHFFEKVCKIFSKLLSPALTIHHPNYHTISLVHRPTHKYSTPAFTCDSSVLPVRLVSDGDHVMFPDEALVCTERRRFDKVQSFGILKAQRLW